MKIIWTEKAVIENEKNIDYLIMNWEQKVLINYLNKLDSLINLLATNPNLGQYDKEIGSRKILVVKQIYMFYEMRDHKIIIRSFWNNYKKPFWL
ncbi:MAG: type II toxin-antitoxin system RelE/ParE family toxin [Polaribacter sp.]